MITNCMSIFCLREKGGIGNFPSKVVPNPQGGIIVLPYFGETLAAMKKKPSRKREARRIRLCFNLREKSGNWNLGPPSYVKTNPQGGIFMFPLMGPGFNIGINEKASSGAKSSTPAKSPKPKKPKKGRAAHKKLHLDIHPILAEACDKVMGRRLKRECDSSSMTPLVTVPGQKKKRESKLTIVGQKFREARAGAAGSIPNRFRVVLIEEGMGNSNDCYYYTKDALESGVDIFTGLKIMVDHPSMTEEETRPERSTRDVIGHYENLKVEIAPDGQAQLCADINILPIPATELQRAQMVRAVENAGKFPDRDFVGLSINASGPSQETPIDDVMKMAPDGAKQKLVDAQAEGVETVKIVSKINRAVSCDLVTEAGAGGKILNIIGGNSDGQKTA